MNAVDIWAGIDPKLIAILRGIRPDETRDIVMGLLNRGVHAIEIPLNSPDPFESIAIARECVPPELADRCLIGAGTVLTIDDVDEVVRRGGNLVVSPNVSTDVVSHCVEQQLACMPGVFTATEAHLAVRLDATALKFFPASQLGPGGIKAIAATLPADTSLCAVGGVDVEDIAAYRAVGVSGFGLGTSLYQPGFTADEVAQRAARFVASST